MKSRSRQLLRISAWAVSMLSVAFFAFWVWLFWNILMVGSGYLTTVATGGAVLFRWDSHGPGTWDCSHDPTSFCTVFDFAWDYRPGRLFVEFPLCAPALIFALCAMLLWHRYRRSLLTAPAETCSKCRYNRAGLAADAKCPECGLVPSAAVA